MGKIPKRIVFKGATYVRADGPRREWPVYRSERAKEHDQVAAVFSLGGGELEDTSWAGYADWYEGVPEYAHSDFPDWHSGSYRTVIVSGGGFLPNPTESLTDADGIVWTLQGSFTSSGETDCPICGAGAGDYFVEGFTEAFDAPPGPDDRCSLCETLVKDMPGVVYIGESYEAVYKAAQD